MLINISNYRNKKKYVYIYIIFLNKPSTSAKKIWSRKKMVIILNIGLIGHLLFTIVLTVYTFHSCR